MTSPETPSEETASRAVDVAEHAASHTLLNLYLLEGGAWRPMPASQFPDLAGDGDEWVAVLPFPDLRAVLIVGINHLSPTHRHRFNLPARLAVAGGNPIAVGFDTLASMLADELGDTGQGDELSAPGSRGPDPTALLARIRSSVTTVSGFLVAREDDIDGLWSADPVAFIDGEQAQLLGHQGHPTPKSRVEMDPEQIDAYAPETAARFALHWLAVDPSLVEHHSAVDEPAPQLAEALLRSDPAVDQAALDAALEPLGERVLLPIHPWELEYLREHDRVAAALLNDGQIVDLGALGSPVAPTTSVRTVYGPQWPWQLKLSLHVRVSNALRVNRRRELRRADETARLLRTEVGDRAREIAPDLVLLTEPAQLAVRHGGELINGLSVLFRENRWQDDSADVSAVTVLCQSHPFGGRSRLAQLIDAIAQRDGRPAGEVAREWFARYCETLVVPLLRLYTEVGLVAESHQQNTLLELEDSWPARTVLRSGRLFHRAAAQADLAQALPDIGELSETTLDEADAEPRVMHYLLLNNALGVISALGLAELADEAELLRDLRAVLEGERERAAGAPYPATILDRLLDDPTWDVKGNMRTRLEDFDELAGGTANSNVFVSILNPLTTVT